MRKERISSIRHEARMQLGLWESHTLVNGVLAPQLNKYSTHFGTSDHRRLEKTTAKLISPDCQEAKQQLLLFTAHCCRLASTMAT